MYNLGTPRSFGGTIPNLNHTRASVSRALSGGTGSSGGTLAGMSAGERGQYLDMEGELTRGMDDIDYPALIAYLSAQQPDAAVEVVRVLLEHVPFYADPFNLPGAVIFRAFPQAVKTLATGIK